MPDYVTRQAVREMQEIMQAQADVCGVVGPLPAMDSATAVYTEALKRMGTDATTLRAIRTAPTAGARTLFQLTRDKKRRTGASMVAMDSASQSRREAMFPNGGRLR